MRYKAKHFCMQLGQVVEILRFVSRLQCMSVSCSISEKGSHEKFH